MPSFYTSFESTQRPDWTQHYLPYAQFKIILEEFATRRSRLDEYTISCRSGFVAPGLDSNIIDRFYDLDSTVMRDFKGMSKSKHKRDRYLAFVEKEELCHMLDSAIQKIGRFYLEQIDRLSSWLDNLNSKREGSNDDGGAYTFDSYKPLVKEFLELYLFVGVNVTALRQLLIRYDCMVRTLNGPPLGQWYIVQRRNLAWTKDELFEALFTRRKLILLSNKLTMSMIQREENYGMEVNSQVSQIEMNIRKSERAVDMVMSDRWAIEDKLAYYFLAGSLLSDVMMVPSFILSRGKTLSNEIEFFANWRDKTMESDDLGLLPVIETESPKKLKDILSPSLLLSFAAQLLYMIGHYIVEPSSMSYIRELGGNDALAGLLIGMAPASALISAFAYSVWSNKSFREPLLCSGVFLIVGSFTYASALQFHSLTLAMFGRFLQGLGSPCVMSIRHIADTVNADHRTAVSAIYTSVSAVGMSLGPGLAVLLDYIDVEVSIPLLGQVTVNGLSAPGYLMTFLWFVYYIGIIKFFVDEERIGLQEKTRNSNQTLYKPPIGIHDDSAQLNPTLSSRSEATSIYVEEGGQDEREDESSSQRLNEATVVCMSMKFIGKFVLEILGCSVSILSNHRYNWNVKNIGTLSFLNGCLIIPLSTLVGYLSQNHSDKSLLRGLLVIAGIGTLLLFDLSDFVQDVNDDYVEWRWAAVGPKRYVIGMVLVFCGFQAAQSVVMSMMSKVIPVSLAKGTFNTGFIITSIVTVSRLSFSTQYQILLRAHFVFFQLARATGDCFITLMALISIRQLLNLLAMPSFILATFTVMLSIFHGHQLDL